MTLLNYRRGGTPFWNQVSLSALRDPTGAITHFVGVQFDVTARMRAARDLTAYPLPVGPRRPARPRRV